MMGFLISLLKFKEEHFIWFILILILILSYFVPFPYLHDFVRWIVKEVIEFIGITSS